MVVLAALGRVLLMVFRKPKRSLGDAMQDQFWYFNFREDNDVRFFVASEIEEDRLGPLFEEMGLSKEKEEDSNFEGKTIKIVFTDVSNIRKLAISSPFARENKVGELVYNKLGHSVYVYRDFAALIYSSRAKEWKFYINGNSQLWNNIEVNIIFKMVMARVMSLTMENFPVVGFYGVPVEEGIVIMNPKESRGEFIFYDVQFKKIYTQDGVKELHHLNKILRLQSTTSSYEKRMNKEELFSFLMARTTLLSMGISSFGHLNAVKKLMGLSEGIIFPENSFKPRVSVGA